MKWNDAKTSLPAESGRYLGYMGKTDIYRYDHAAKKFYREEGDSQSETPCVVHYWMELPLAPKAA